MKHIFVRKLQINEDSVSWRSGPANVLQLYKNKIEKHLSKKLLCRPTDFGLSSQDPCYGG